MGMYDMSVRCSTCRQRRTSVTKDNPSAAATRIADLIEKQIRLDEALEEERAKAVQTVRECHEKIVALRKLLAEEEAKLLAVAICNVRTEGRG